MFKHFLQLRSQEEYNSQDCILCELHFHGQLQSALAVVQVLLYLHYCQIKLNLLKDTGITGLIKFQYSKQVVQRKAKLLSHCFESSLAISICFQCVLSCSWLYYLLVNNLLATITKCLLLIYFVVKELYFSLFFLNGIVIGIH